uniref:serine hydrolase-like protein isoform X1 n=1 Tax=Styela clava TaxID=7725 RepID=UPI001939A1E1|nr:serine hydrolase-like protein isoform X1 [Styela clava]
MQLCEQSTSINISTLRRRKAMTSNSTKYVGTSERGLTKEFTFPVSWGLVAGKTWGDKKNPPIICLHGWLDNCNTFDKLIPLLPKSYYYITMDFPGHGLSSHLSKGMYYTELVICIAIKRLLNYFNIEEVSMIGHSMGGNMALHFSAIYPDIVKRVVVIDTFGVFTILEDTLADSLRRWIKDNMQLDDAEPRKEKQYTYEEAKAKLLGASSHLNDESGKILLERSTKELENGKRTFTRDVRNYTLLPIERTLKTSLKLVENVRADVLFIEADNGVIAGVKNMLAKEFSRSLDIFEKFFKSFKMVNLEGRHHLHLCTPSETAEEITTFFQEHPVHSDILSKL